MVTTYSAGPQAIGYLYQPRYALYTLLVLGLRTEEAAVVVEGLDDIEKQDETGTIELTQLKHVQASLTDTSTELWKTLRIWSSELARGTWTPDKVRLSLVTTGVAPRDSAAWYLRGGSDRNEQKALELLTEAAQKSRTNDPTLRECFKQFESLTAAQQLRLLSAVTIIDGAETIAEIVASIKRLLVFSAPTNKVQLDLLYEQLEGWWFARVVQHLLHKAKEPLAFQEVHRKCWSITVQFKEDDLPTDYRNAVPDDVVNPKADERIFVHQLRILSIGEERIKKAILDYYRAFAQRASWVRNQLLIDDELEHYEQKLTDAWETFKLSLEDEHLSPEAAESECLHVGRELLKWMETRANVKIRPHVEDGFVMRGSYHILADARTPRVYWHPKFIERIAEILGR